MVQAHFLSLGFISTVLQFIKPHKYLSFQHFLYDFKTLALF